MGEPGTSALPLAVTDAIFAATGVRLRKLPPNRCAANVAGRRPET